MTIQRESYTCIIEAEHAIVLDHIREETAKDKHLQKLYQRILKEDWEKYRKDEFINPYYSIKEELYIADGLIFSLNQIIIPMKLQHTVTKAAHSLGHLGIT